MVVHTNTADERDMEKYRRILETQEVISFKDYLKVQPVKRRLAGRLAEYLLAAVKHILVKYG